MSHLKYFALNIYRVVARPEEGLDLAHLKRALRGLAKLHALSHAYFNKTSETLDDVKEFSEVQYNILPFQLDKYMFSSSLYFRL